MTGQQKQDVVPLVRTKQHLWNIPNRKDDAKWLTNVVTFFVDSGIDMNEFFGGAELKFDDDKVLAFAAAFEKREGKGVWQAKLWHDDETRLPLHMTSYYTLNVELKTCKEFPIDAVRAYNTTAHVVAHTTDADTWSDASSENEREILFKSSCPSDGARTEHSARTAIISIDVPAGAIREHRCLFLPRDVISISRRDGAEEKFVYIVKSKKYDKVHVITETRERACELADLLSTVNSPDGSFIPLLLVYGFRLNSSPTTTLDAVDDNTDDEESEETEMSMRQTKTFFPPFVYKPTCRKVLARESLDYYVDFQSVYDAKKKKL